MQAQTATAGIRIHCVPMRNVATVMRSPDVRALLARGMAAARIDDAMPTILHLMAGTKQLWLLFSEDSAKPLAAWTTVILPDEGDAHWMVIGELAGSQAPRWARMVSERMVAFARDEGCNRVSFFGKRGWGRLVRGFIEIGEHDGIWVFERRLTP
jgi:hypothetical protein